MVAKKFSPGDKIFAKVRGYPPWPARVEGVADETPNKMKYHIFFYGTNETAICKAEELFPYLEFREKYGKPIKKKGFNEALEQVDLELGVCSTPKVGKDERMPEDSDVEGNLVIDETPDGQSSRKSLVKNKKQLQTPVLKKDKTPKRKQDDSINTEDSETKKGRVSSIKKASQIADESAQNKSLETTRSGRKVKPKKFADHTDEPDMENDDDGSYFEILKPTSAAKTNKKSVDDSNQSDAKADVSNSNDDSRSDETYDNVVLDPEFINTGLLIAHTPGGQEFKLKLDLGKNRPTFKNDKARQQWEEKVIRDGKMIKAQIESGGKIPENVKRDLEERYNARLTQQDLNKTNTMLDDKKEKLVFLKQEANLLDIDCRIKSCITLKHADVDSCLRVMDELLELQLNPLMLKKHPHTVETIKKLRKYVGNTACWKLSDGEAELFMAKAAAVRLKADHIYNKIKSMFLVPRGKSFWDVFAEKLTEFNNETEKLSADELFVITTDPTEKKNKLTDISNLSTIMDKKSSE